MRFGGREPCVATVAQRALAGAFADALDSVEIRLQRCAHAGGGVLRELQPGAFDDQVLVGTRKVVFEADSRRGEFLELLLRVDGVQVGGETAQPPVAQQRFGEHLVFVAAGSQPQPLRQFRRARFGNACGNVVDDSQRPGKRMQAR